MSGARLALMLGILFAVWVMLILFVIAPRRDEGCHDIRAESPTGAVTTRTICQ